MGFLIALIVLWVLAIALAIIWDAAKQFADVVDRRRKK